MLKIATTILGFFVFEYVSKGYVIKAVIYLKTFLLKSYKKL